MKVKEIVQIEKENKDGIILLREGYFYRAYNVSAMRMEKNVKVFNIQSKFIKYLDQTVFLCGFPKSILSSIRDICVSKGYVWEIENENRIDIRGVKIEGEDYAEWIKSVSLKCCDAKDAKRRNVFCSGMTPVVEHHYDLLLWLLPKLANFPKDQRFLLGDRIQRQMLDILEILIEAVYTCDREELLRLANIKLDQLRFLARLTKDMKYISIKRYDYFCQKVLEIGRMVGGWKKASMDEARNPVLALH